MKAAASAGCYKEKGIPNRIMNVDPIIAVSDVEASSAWYQAIFDCKSIHGGPDFDVLATSRGDVMLCLHKWGEDDHPTLYDPGIPVGNGLLLYFRTKNIEQLWAKVVSLDLVILKELAVSDNSHVKEFSLRDLDGYYLTIAEHHTFGS